LRCVHMRCVYLLLKYWLVFDAVLSQSVSTTL
jgi:hypothetical protein